MSVVRANPNSQYDPGLIIKEVHDFSGQFIRTGNAKSLVPNYFSHLVVEYNVSNDPIIVDYYRGLTSHLTNVFPVADNALSLQNKYLIVRDNPSGKLYHIWYNVDGLGVNPAPANSIGIEVPIMENDSSSIISLATVSVINALFSSVFLATNNGTWFELRTVGVGTITPSSDFNTGFTLQNVSGTQTLVKKIEISYDIDGNPIYDGQVLKGYSYDLYSSNFFKNPEISLILDASTSSVSVGDSDGDKLEINPDGSINVNVVQTDQILKSYFNEIINVATGVTEELITYTATASVYLQKIEFAGTNIAQFELTVDGITVDKKRTFFNGNLENVFNFDRGLNLINGQIVRVYVVHNRPELGEFSARLQILE